MMSEEATEQLAFDALGARLAGEAGMEKAISADRVQAWRQYADAWLAVQPIGRTFTSDDLVRDIGLPDEGVNRNNAVGAWFSGKSKARRIEWTGRFSGSSRVIRHGNSQRIWRVT